MKKSELETEMISLGVGRSVRRYHLRGVLVAIIFFVWVFRFRLLGTRIVQLKTAFALGQWVSRTAVRHRVKQILARGRSIYVLVEDSTQHCGG